MSRRIALAAALDVASVLLFVALGRRSHDETTSVLTIAGPFLVALAIGWLLSRAWRAPFPLRTGAIVWVVTVGVGMVLRHWVWDRGTALSFMIVATLVLATFLLGWRALARVVVRSRHAQHA